MPRPLVARGGAGWSWNSRYCSCCCFGGIIFLAFRLICRRNVLCCATSNCTLRHGGEFTADYGTGPVLVCALSLLLQRLSHKDRSTRTRDPLVLNPRTVWGRVENDSVRQSVRHFRDFMGLFFLQYISFAPDPYCHAFFSEEKKSQFFHPRFAFLFTISLCAHVEMTDFRRCYLSFPFLPRNWIYTRRAGETRNLPLFVFSAKFFRKQKYMYLTNVQKVGHWQNFFALLLANVLPLGPAIAPWRLSPNKPTCSDEPEKVSMAFYGRNKQFSNYPFLFFTWKMYSFCRLRGN